MTDQEKEYDLNDIEQFEEWLENKKNPDGTITLSQHPDLIAFMHNMSGRHNHGMPNLKHNLGESVNFELNPSYMSKK